MLHRSLTYDYDYDYDRSGKTGRPGPPGRRWPPFEHEGLPQTAAPGQDWADTDL
ncbi:hypothetical protein [Streptomyces sp. NPDC046751]|uniref:hypothetical protein n=1 Tax=unclassified Streptomyces TaxID=2593676 RepID=UPI0033CD9ED1